MDDVELRQRILKIIQERSDEKLGRLCTLEFIFRQFGVGGNFIIRIKTIKLRAEIQSALSQLSHDGKIMRFQITHFYQETIHDKKLSIDKLTVEKSFWVSGYVPIDYDEVLHRCYERNRKTKHNSLDELKKIYF